ncbi:MAG: hypothetical protein RLZZ157_489 [Pseudomonadota bacterium]|jgi:EAL domain-containing protein (putative c-di-GMP-specific phosphodiesterase class I)
MNKRPSNLDLIAEAPLLAAQSLALLGAAGCGFDGNGRLNWVDPHWARQLLGVDIVPTTIQELNARTNGGVDLALHTCAPVALGQPKGLEISADPVRKLIVLRSLTRHTGLIQMPAPAQEVGAHMLLRALADKRMCLFRQPIVSARDASIVRYECLSRLIHEDGRIAHPTEYIPDAERAGIVGALDLDTLELALQALAKDSLVHLAVNVSAATIADQGSRRAYKERLAAGSDLANRLTIEITETIAIQDIDIAARFGQAIKAAGARLALDDFGEGHSSFQSLRALPLDEVKIDGLYVQDIDARAQSRAFVIAIDRLARDLGMETVAERVETAQEASALRAIGVDGLQGFYYGKPQSPRYAPAPCV